MVGAVIEVIEVTENQYVVMVGAINKVTEYHAVMMEDHEIN